MRCAVLYFVGLAAALGSGFHAAVPVTVVLAATSLLATLKNHDNDDDDEQRKILGEMVSYVYELHYCAADFICYVYIFHT